ncbi:hypothetical protein BKA70DRAFT_1427793 [Coprinopsis sp. MPI-PUGE-AT-0042]|nr:hypothetical protein BKA70DRAFT_1427793 [Coprinopsis sp. MPI-PUGE-AT-0042]
MLHNSVFTVKEAVPETVNTSIQKLVCPSIILLQWPPIKLSSLKYFKLVFNEVMQHWEPRIGDYFLQEEEENDKYLPRAGAALTQLTSQILTIDVRSVDIEIDTLFAFLSQFGALKSLLLKAAEPFLSDALPVQRWRREPNIATIISQQFFSLPSSLWITAQDSVAPPSTPPSFLLMTPHEHHQPEAANFRFSFTTLTEYAHQTPTMES